MIGSTFDGHKFSDGAEIKLLIDWMASDFNIDIKKEKDLYVAYSKETKNVLFYSSDVNVIFNALLILAEKEE